MNRPHRLIFAYAITVWLSSIVPCLASDKQFLTCPDQIAESSITLKNVDGDWKPYIAAPLYLHSVAPTDGPPERLGQLMGKQVRSGRDAWTDIYDLTGEFPQGKWLQCSYGMLNEVVLARRLDGHISSCTIKGRKGEKAGQNVFNVTCR